MAQDLWNKGWGIVNDVGKQSATIVKDAVMPEVERIAYNISSTILLEFNQNIRNVTENTKNDMVPELERLTVLFMIGMLVSASIIFCGLVIVAIGLARRYKQATNNTMESNCLKNKETVNGLNTRNNLINGKLQSINPVDGKDRQFNV